MASCSSCGGAAGRMPLILRAWRSIANCCSILSMRLGVAGSLTGALARGLGLACKAEGSLLLGLSQECARAGKAGEEAGGSEG
eukprot:5490138-Amphidinium_carterae.1